MSGEDGLHFFYGEWEFYILRPGCIQSGRLADSQVTDTGC